MTWQIPYALSADYAVTFTPPLRRAVDLARELWLEADSEPLHRLLDKVAELREAACVIVVAGMDGALPSVVAGLVAAPVVAVPTSVGYGAAFGGLAPLLTMLNSCSPGVTVVNIDNGFGAAMAASRMLGMKAAQ